MNPDTKTGTFERSQKMPVGDTEITKFDPGFSSQINLLAWLELLN